MTDVATERGTPPILHFPTSRYPTGWFQVGWADDVAPCESSLLRYFGKQIVLWRTESGTLKALDAHCLHLGGNLAVQGTVDGDEIVCPWHGWHWDGEGHNTLIPYGSQKCKPQLRMHVWPVCEWYGMVLMWHDQLDREPLWDPPVFEELDRGECYPWERDVFRVKAHIQNVVDNHGDPAHMVYVHGAGEFPELSEFKGEGHEWRATFMVTYGAGKGATWQTPNGPVNTAMKVYQSGLGMGFARWPEELGSGLFCGFTTPIDDTYCDMFFAMTTKRQAGSDELPEYHRRLVESQKEVTKMDFFTWENMQVLEKPNFVPEEAAIMFALRRWSSQFYPEYGTSSGLESR